MECGNFDCLFGQMEFPLSFALLTMGTAWNE